MNEQELSTSTQNGEELQILLKTPDKNGQFPVVILVQGFGMDMHEYRNSHDEIADGLIASGIASVQFDFSYQKYAREKTGTELSVRKRAEELNTIMYWAQNHPGIDSGRIGLLGTSMGAYTILSSKLHLAKSLCLVSGLGFVFEKFVARFEARGVRINRSGTTKLPRSSGKITVVEPDFWAGLESHHQEELVKKLNKPILIIHGDQDSILTTVNAEKVYASIESSLKRLHIFEGGSHGMSDVPSHMRDEFLRVVIDWFKETL
jgi:dienelactone hydrolase